MADLGIVYRGYSSFLYRWNGKTIAVDPTISEFSRGAWIKRWQPDSCDFMFVTHAHFDHFADAAARAVAVGQGMDDVGHVAQRMPAQQHAQRGKAGGDDEAAGRGLGAQPRRPGAEAGREAPPRATSGSRRSTDHGRPVGEG